MPGATYIDLLKRNQELLEDLITKHEKIQGDTYIDLLLLVWNSGFCNPDRYE